MKEIVRKRRRRQKIEYFITGKKICSCKKTKCLKLYCECFALGQYCTEECTCINCYNKEQYKEELEQARQELLKKNDKAFNSNRTVNKGCNCKNSNCLKNYCECFRNNLQCDPNVCKCINCKNCS